MRPTAFSFMPGVTSDSSLVAPPDRQLKVAFAINPGVQVIDLAGPWEVFQDTILAAHSPHSLAGQCPFDLFTVSESTSPIRGTGGLTILPAHSIDKAPVPDIVIIPHFSIPAPLTSAMTGIHDWIIAAHARGALTVSICAGAFQLAKTGLLDRQPATTNVRAYETFARIFPAVDLLRGPRFVETGMIATAGGLSAGIDLALRIVSRYFGEDVASETACAMEYVGDGWIV